MTVIETATRMLRERAEARREREAASAARFQAFIDAHNSRRAPEDVMAEALTKFAATIPDEPARPELDLGRPPYGDIVRGRRPQA